MVLIVFAGVLKDVEVKVDDAAICYFNSLKRITRCVAIKCYCATTGADIAKGGIGHHATPYPKGGKPLQVEATRQENLQNILVALHVIHYKILEKWSGMFMHIFISVHIGFQTDLIIMGVNGSFHQINSRDATRTSDIGISLGNAGFVGYRGCFTS